MINLLSLSEEAHHFFSVAFAQLVLQENLWRRSGFLFDFSVLSSAHVVELGYVVLVVSRHCLCMAFVLSAGTGMLSIVLSPLVKKYTVTDIEDLIPLIRKNIAMNLPIQAQDSNIEVMALDWNTVLNAKPNILLNLIPSDIDLVLLVDGIYHPSLLPAFISTLNALCTPGQTTVLILVELRSEETIREFLQMWLDDPSQWEIWRISAQTIGPPYAMWAGWKPVKVGG